MEVLLARKAGFCFGVKRAIDVAEKAAQDGPAASYGPLIHNRQVVERLEQTGLRTVDDLRQCSGKVVVRSHGVGPDTYDRIKELDLELIDATCPFVQKAQRLAQESEHQGRKVVIVGDRNHPEVQGILGWTNQRGIVVESPAEAEKLPLLGPAAVLAQTTQPLENFLGVVEVLRRKNSDVVEHSTICSATSERQEAARVLARQVEVMIVAGGRDSSNTKKLVKLCAAAGTPTYQVESASDLNQHWFVGVNRAGLTAGASTPDWIIEEVFRKMSEINVPGESETQEQQDNDFEDMASWERSLQDLRKGQVVKGIVVRITSDEVLVDIHSKSEGIIPRNELAVRTPTHPGEVLSIGDEVNVMILRVENEDGYPVLSKRRADQFAVIDSIEDAYDSSRELNAKVVEVVKGGLLVDIGMRGFVPASQIQRGFVEDLGQFVGKNLRLRVLEFDRQKNKVVLSQKVILEEEAKSARETLWTTLAEGQVVQGTVRRLTNFGAFVDIGGTDGLLHVSDMSYSRVKHPSEIVKEGDEIQVVVLKLDREHQKVSLGLKQIKPSPWESAGENYPVGAVVEGTVARLAPFGAFVKLEDGVDGLIHISQLADKRVIKPEEVVEVGQTVQAKVIECKPLEKRISLSLKDVRPDKEQEEVAQALQNQQDDLGATIGEALGRPAGEKTE